jgi:DNA processing protein
MTTETEDLLWIASQESRMIPHEIIRFAVNNNKSLIELLEMDEHSFQGVDKDNIKKFLQNRETIPFEVCQKIFDHMQKKCINMITYRDSLFPLGLKKLEEKNIPVVLYHQGKKMKYENCIAVVGTRNCSTYATEITREISRTLAKQGYVIVAGLARGIDAVAHRGAISVNGNTVAVLPWFYDPYPPEHERLLIEIQNHGSVISENFFPSQRLDKYKFLQRNAIISAISEVLIAVESSFSGGTRWQVELALGQGKKVIAMEPEKSNELSYDGFVKFVKKGALSASSASEAVEIVRKHVEIKDHVLDEYNLEDEMQVKPLRKSTVFSQS